MSRCRARSFYLAPGQYRSFDRWALFTYTSDGTLRRVTHRRDIAALEDGDPGWDHVCYVVPKAAAADFETARFKHPEAVEVWRLDRRLIDGKRPHGPAFVLHKLAFRGADALGGAAVVDAACPTLPAPVRATLKAAIAPMRHGTAQARVLRFANAAGAVLDEAAQQKLLARLDGWFADVPSRDVDIDAAVDVAYLGRYDPTTRLRLLVDLWRSTIERELAAMTYVLFDTGRYRSARRSHAELVAHWYAQAPNAFVALLRNASFDALDWKLPTAAIAAAATNRAARARFALHPDAPVELAAGIFDDRDILDGRDLERPDSAADLAPATIDALEAGLARTARHHTHSPARAVNVAALAGLVVAARPTRDNQVRFAEAFAARLRVADEHTWFQELDALAEDAPAFAPDIAARMWNDLHRWHRRLSEQQQRRNANGTRTRVGAPPSFQERLSRSMEAPADLLVALDASEDLPPAIREILDAVAADAGWCPHPRRPGRLPAHRWLAVCGEDLDADDVDAWVAARYDRAPATRAQLAFDASAAHTIGSDVAGAIASGALPPTTARAVADAVERVGHARLRAAADALVSHEPRYRTRPSALTSSIEGARGGIDKEVRALRALADVFDGTPVSDEDLNLAAQSYWVEPHQLVAIAGDTGPGRAQDVAEQFRRLGHHDTGGAALAATLAGAPIPPRPKPTRLTGRITGPYTAALDDRIVWPKAPRRWAQLPTVEHTPFTYADEIRDIDGRDVTVGGRPMRLELFASQLELDENANRMGNCTAGFGRDIRRGDTALFALRDLTDRDEPVLYNVEVNLTEDLRRRGEDDEPRRWDVGEINVASNAGVSAEERRQVTAAVLEQLPYRHRPKRRR